MEPSPDRSRRALAPFPFPELEDSLLRIILHLAVRTADGGASAACADAGHVPGLSDFASDTIDDYRPAVPPPPGRLKLALVCKRWRRILVLERDSLAPRDVFSRTEVQDFLAHAPRVTELSFPSDNFPPAFFSRLGASIASRIRNLDFHYKGRRVPDAISELKGLTALRVRSASFQNIALPESISALTALKTITVSLLEEFPTSFKQLSSLEHMSLLRLRAHLPPWIADLPSLCSLVLHDPREKDLSVLLPPSFWNLTGLTSLALIDCQWGRAYPAQALGALHGLKDLKLIAVTGFIEWACDEQPTPFCIPKGLSSLTGLTSIDLQLPESSREARDALEALVQFPNLEHASLVLFSGCVENGVQGLASLLEGLRGVPVADLTLAGFDELPSDSVAWSAVSGLTRLELCACKELVSLPAMMGYTLRQLEKLNLVECPNVEHIGTVASGLQVGSLPKLKKLSVSNCDDQRLAFPGDLRAVTSLTCISLEVQGLEDGALVFDDGIRSLTALRSLTLGDFPAVATQLCQLSLLQHLVIRSPSSLPANFGDLAGLTSLDIEFASTLPDSFGSLQSLKQLCLAGEDLRALPPNFCQLGPHLQGLHLTLPNLHDLPAGFGCFTALRNLTLAGTQGMAKGGILWLPPSFTALKSLQDLHLESYNLSALPETLGALSSLTQLVVRCPLLDSVPASIGALGRLISLELRSNKIRVLPPDVGGLGRLRKLFVDACSLRSLPLSLFFLPHLCHLEAHGSPELRKDSEAEALLADLRAKGGLDTLVVAGDGRPLRSAWDLMAE